MSSYFLSPIARGLGDLIVSLPALEGLISTGLPTYLVLRSPVQYGLCDRIPGLGGSINEVDFNPYNLQEGDAYFNLRKHKLQTEYLWGSQEFDRVYPGYLIGDIVREISNDLGIPQTTRNRLPLISKPVPEINEKAVFIPGSAGSMKCWPANQWLQLANFLRKEGIEVLVVGQKDKCVAVKEVCERGLKHIETLSLERALDVISAAKLVVGVDTGLSHLAVNQGIPTVMLFRQNSIFKRSFEHVRSVIAAECHSQCLIRELAGEFNTNLDFRDSELFNKMSYWETWHCVQEEDMWCMAKITVKEVAEAALSLLESVVKPIH